VSRIQFHELSGFRFLELDFTNLDDTPTVLRLCEEARAVIAREPHGSVFTLTRVAGSRFNREIVDAFRRLVAADRPYVRAAAIVGLTRMMRLAYNAVIRLSGRHIPAFESEGDALAYLREQAGI
jgi:hypothetical protein